jgi:hypothetical protein
MHDVADNFKFKLSSSPFTNGHAPQSDSRRHRQSPRRQFRRGQRAAVLRAITGYYLYTGQPIAAHTLKDAAERTGSNPRYIEAIETILKSEDQFLLDEVLIGRWSLLEAAARVKKRAKLISAFREADPADLRALARTVGPAEIFDNVITPVL